jgi:DIS3-like exonuclease 2
MRSLSEQSVVMVVEGGEDSVDKEKKRNRCRSNRRSKQNHPNPGNPSLKVLIMFVFFGC